MAQQEQVSEYTNLLLNNRLLAKRNSTMTSNIAKLELRISKLMAENIQLKQQSIAEKVNQNALREQQLVNIEACVTEKFQEISRMLKNMKESGGIFRDVQPARAPAMIQEIIQPPSDFLTNLEAPLIPKEKSLQRDKKKILRPSRRKSMYIPSGAPIDSEKESKPDNSESSIISLEEDVIPELLDLASSKPRPKRRHSQEFSITREGDRTNIEELDDDSSDLISIVLSPKKEFHVKRDQSQVETGKRRTRGTTVNYKLPSLRTKMRREGKKFASDENHPTKKPKVLIKKQRKPLSSISNNRQT